LLIRFTGFWQSWSSIVGRVIEEKVSCLQHHVVRRWLLIKKYGAMLFFFLNVHGIESCFVHLLHYLQLLIKCAHRNEIRHVLIVKRFNSVFILALYYIIWRKNVNKLSNFKRKPFIYFSFISLIFFSSSGFLGIL